MILLFFTIPLILFGIIYIISYLKWLENKKMTNQVTQKAHKRFTDLKGEFSKLWEIKINYGIRS